MGSILLEAGRYLLHSTAQNQRRGLLFPIQDYSQAVVGEFVASGVHLAKDRVLD